MSCNGCRILRKGCSDDCTLRQCLHWIDNPQAQANATIFVAKFFGRASLMSFISSVPENQRPSLFQSLFFEAVGRTVNPVSGAVGLLWTGNWHVCQTAVMTVLHGGSLEPILELDLDNFSESASFRPRNVCSGSKTTRTKRKRSGDDEGKLELTNHELCFMYPADEKQLAETPLEEESETTTLGVVVLLPQGRIVAQKETLARRVDG
ncbi:hypothetical protein GH714_032008 [Hevea brasiliensis]|uniref:LOB domain-containing protein n=1 Tax=Hevea brasiliensis TaxID=3981 RepID=A0A6A6N475_HEVBR|nr:hypothetical protein GH714_032008 [Hevea brasiliensis]